LGRNNRAVRSHLDRQRVDLASYRVKGHYQPIVGRDAGAAAATQRSDDQIAAISL
jgi:hypothetical protein